jgi:hypothetical protein
MPKGAVHAKDSVARADTGASPDQTRTTLCQAAPLQPAPLQPPRQPASRPYMAPARKQRIATGDVEVTAAVSRPRAGRVKA